MKTRPNTVDEWQEFLGKMYGDNNATYYQGTLELIAMLSLMVKKLASSIRKGKTDDIPRRVANCISRTFAIANRFPGLYIRDCLAIKYPVHGCAYCGMKPCRCGENRHEHIPATTVDSQLDWNFKIWQDHLDAVYGEKNRTKDTDYIVGRLFEEISELLAIAIEVDHVSKPATEIKHEYGKELADVFAWLFAIANMFDINIDHAISLTYSNGCPTCNELTCICTKFVINNGQITHGTTAESMAIRLNHQP